MQVIGGRERPEPLLEPGIDFIFERAIDQEAGERVIDTGFTFVPPVLTRLNGRKYIGENTVRDLGKLIGLVDGDEARRIQAEFDIYRENVGRIFNEFRSMSVNIDRLIANPLSDGSTAEPVPVPPLDRAEQIQRAEYQAQVEGDQIAAAESAAAAPQDEGGAAAEEDDDVGVKHLTGSERVALERQVGPLQEVGDRGDLVNVPDDLEKAAEGVEEISTTEVAKLTYNRGIGHAEARQEELAAADEASQAGDVEADTPHEDAAEKRDEAQNEAEQADEKDADESEQ